MEVFYHLNEQHRILAADIEKYLRPIYQSEARFVIPLLSPTFPKKFWTKFESDQFKTRFGQDSVIPIWFSTSPPGMFDETRRVGGVTLDLEKELSDQVNAIVRLLIKKLSDVRGQQPAMPAGQIAKPEVGFLEQEHFDFEEIDE